MKRFKTSYPGVFYRESKRIGRKGNERIYYIVFKKNGKVIEEKTGRQYADDMTPAKAARIRSELIEGKRLSRKEKRAREEAQKQVKANKWTVDRLWKEYKAGRKDNKALSTDSGRYKNYLESPFGKKEPKDIDALSIERLRRTLMKERSPQTVKHVLNLLTWIINFGVKKGLCQGLSFHVEKPTVHNEKTEDLTPKQLQSLLVAIENDTHPQAGPMMKLAIYSGMRRSEMFKLKWKHVNFNTGFIHIVDPKGGQPQKIPLNDAARKILKNHPKTKKSPYVFPGRAGKQRADINKPIAEIKTKAGLPKEFRALHGLRHVYASMLASSGKVDLYHLQKLLTHKDPRMTQRYAHLRDETLKKASNIAGEIVKQTIDEQKEKKGKGKAVGLKDHKI